ncbi:MAG: triose-phosphate isomerase [Phycisphaerales bacterium]
MSRRPFVAGNWKMNLDRAGAAALAAAVSEGYSAHADAVGCAVCPTFVHLDAVGSALEGGSVALGAQDVYHEADGAFTGEISTTMLTDLGVRYVLTGHSERRHVIGESDELVGRKTAAGLAAGLHVILCVGETIEQRRADETDAVNERQIRAGMADVPADTLNRLTIAYEPVWAIGTGETATPDDAQAAHARIRALITEMCGAQVADAMRILYGGSMKPGNAAELIGMPDIDGGLIGGASLKADSFLEIVAAARQ